VIARGVHRVAIARVLDPDPVTRPPGHRVQQPHAVRRPAGHDDLVRLAGDAADPAKMLGQRDPQVRDAGGVLVPAARRLRAHLAPDPPPARIRPAVDVRDPGPQRERLAPGRRTVVRPAGRRPGKWGQLGHVGAGADPAGDPALGVQLVVRALRDRARHPELPGQFAARREPVPRPQPPVAYRLAELAGDLQVERAGCVAAYRHRHLACRHPSSSCEMACSKRR
jgi:hypothetical protein